LDNFNPEKDTVNHLINFKNLDKISLFLPKNIGSTEKIEENPVNL